MKVEKFVEVLKLFEAYQGCLSEEQFNVLSSFLEQGLMSSEIAENNAVSRQAVSKTLKTAIAKLESLENAVKFVEFKANLRKSLDKIEIFLQNEDTKQAVLEISKLKEL